MNRTHRLLLVCAFIFTVGFKISAAPELPPKPASTISIDPTTTPVAGAGKATLIIGTLTQQGDSFLGDYQVKVSPYSFKNEKGKIVMLVSSDSIRQATNGGKVFITGTSTADNGSVRKIAVTATPTNNNSGTVQISFPGTRRKTIFNSFYRFEQR